MAEVATFRSVVSPRLASVTRRLRAVTTHLLRVAGRLPGVTEHLLQVTMRLLQVSMRLLQVTGHLFAVTMRLPGVTAHLLQVTTRLLPVTGFLLGSEPFGSRSPPLRPRLRLAATPVRLQSARRLHPRSKTNPLHHNCQTEELLARLRRTRCIGRETPSRSSGHEA